MSVPTEENRGTPHEPPEPDDPGFADRVRSTIAVGSAKARSAGERHASIAVPFTAMERDRGVAASVLAGGVAYRLFLWFLPFALVVGGALGLADSESVQETVSTGGLPQAMVDAVGDAARAADTNSLWLLLVGVPLLLYEGYAGARALLLIHSLVWHEPPRKLKPLQSSLAFSGGMCGFAAVIGLTWWLRDTSQLEQLAVAALTVLPLTGLWLWVSLRLPHGSASWKELLPGALLVAVGFQLTHGSVVYFLGPKLESSMSLYGALGVSATLLFYMWLIGRIVVTAPILNSSIHDERVRRHGGDLHEPPSAR